MFDFLKTRNWSYVQAFICQHIHGWIDTSHTQPATKRVHKECTICKRCFWW